MACNPVTPNRLSVRWLNGIHGNSVTDVAVFSTMASLSFFLWWTLLHAFHPDRTNPATIRAIKIGTYDCHCFFQAKYLFTLCIQLTLTLRWPLSWLCSMGASCEHTWEMELHCNGHSFLFSQSLLLFLVDCLFPCSGAMQYQKEVGHVQCFQLQNSSHCQVMCDLITNWPNTIRFHVRWHGSHFSIQVCISWPLINSSCQCLTTRYQDDHVFIAEALPILIYKPEATGSWSWWKLWNSTSIVLVHPWSSGCIHLDNRSLARAEKHYEPFDAFCSNPFVWFDLTSQFFRTYGHSRMKFLSSGCINSYNRRLVSFLHYLQIVFIRITMYFKLVTALLACSQSAEH